MGGGKKQLKPTVLPDVDEIDPSVGDVDVADFANIDLADGPTANVDMVDLIVQGPVDVADSPAELNAVVGHYQQANDQLGMLSTYAELGVFTGPAGALPATEAFGAAMEHDPDLWSKVPLDDFTEVYESHIEGIVEVPQWKLDQLAAAETWVAAKDNPDLTEPERYAALQDYVSKVMGLEDAAGDNWPAEWAALKADTQAYLTSLPPADLRAIAHANGVTHPLLLSGGNPNDLSGKNALATVLDPVYPADAPHKLKIVAAGQKRYQQLADGTIDEYKGVTLTQVDADNAKGGLSPSGAQPQAAGLGPIAVDAEQLANLTTVFGKTVSTRVEDTWTLHRAVPGEGVTQQQLDEARAAHKPKVVYPYAIGQSGKNLEKLSEITGHSPEVLACASHEERQLLVNPATTIADAEAASAAAQARAEMLAETYALADTNKDLFAQTQSNSAGALLTQVISNWHTLSVTADEMPYGVVPEAAHPDWDNVMGKYQVPHGSVIHASASSVRSHLQKVPLGTLRQVAADCGMGELAKPPASRAMVQNWLIGHAKNNEGMKTSAVLAAQAKAAKPKVPQPKPAPAAAAPGGAVPPKPKGVVKPLVTNAQAVGQRIQHVPMQQQLDNLNALANQELATRAAIPPRLTDEQAQALPLVADTTAKVTGGAHTVHGYRDPNTDIKYFAKPYPGSGRDARVVSEAVASQVKDRIGLPTVPCYDVNVGGQRVALQPRLEGVSDLGHNYNPADFSQADVDMFVANEVGDWLIGEHDGHGANWIRGQNGELVRVDLGTAFKWWGGDQLSPSFSPPQAPTSALPLKATVQAQKAGNLPSGVRVNPSAALPTIRRVEQMPADEYRTMIRPVAEAGVANPQAVTWVSTMRSRAAKTHSIPAAQVTNAQIVDEFLDHAEERRANIRQGFIGYFADLGLDASSLAYIDD